MSRLYLLASIVLLPCLSTFAADQTTASEPQTTIHASSDLVIVDVTVTDKDQNAVHGLTADDFKIYEDGHLQTVKNFEEHRGSTTPPPITPMPKLEEGTYTNFTPAPASGPLTILLFDKSSTPVGDQMTLRNQVLKFLKRAQPGTEIAIFAQGERLRLITGFTTDLDQMRALMEKEKPEPPQLLDTVASSLATGSSSSSFRSFGSAEADEAGARARFRTMRTLDALDQIERYLGSLPGRKNIIWFSGSFPMLVGSRADDADPIPESNLSDELKDTFTMMSHSQIAVYPVDTVGLRSDPLFDAESDIDFGSSPTGLSWSAQQQASIQSTNNAHDDFFIEMAQTRAAMQSIAEATGGKFFFNSNDLAGAIEKVLTVGSNYYTIAYVPTKPPQNGYYRKIKVEVASKGVTLAYRRGYYSFDRGARNQATAAYALTDYSDPVGASYGPLNAAMMRGAPAPTQIMLLVSARPTTTTPEPAVAPGNSVEPKVKGPFRRYTLHYNITADNVDCPATPDGIHHCSLQILALVYDSAGNLVNTQVNGLKLSIPPARYKSILSHGIELKQEISVPTDAETYFLRTGVRDVTSGRIGALELPIAEVTKLTPVSVTKP